MKRNTKPQGGVLESLSRPEPIDTPVEDKTQGVILQPALRQIGITECLMCKHELAVFLTKTNRPFINCGYCSLRAFFNGKESMRLLKKIMRPMDGDAS
jgi:DNA-directed RNA polymerase subunit RPC12/RpoP